MIILVIFASTASPRESSIILLTQNMEGDRRHQIGWIYAYYCRRLFLAIYIQDDLDPGLLYDYSEDSL